jgi:hypothetical protein
MPRDYHSPSSIELADKCRKAWGLRYITGLRYGEQPWQPDAAFAAAFVWPDWVDVKYVKAQTEKDRSGRTLAERLIAHQRSSAFGKAMHAIGEGWYHGEAVDWHSEPGKVFLSGAHLLPHPERVHPGGLRIEEPIGTVPYISRHRGGTRLLEVGGIRFMGFIDLEVYPHEKESARLGLPPGWAVIDYKSTKDFKWAKTPEDLQKDAQASLYAYAHAISTRSNGDTPPQRWVYFLTSGARKARAVDVWPEAREAEARVHLMVEQAKRLDTLETIDQCMPNPSACPEYGGCEFHVTKGGPCNAERRLGAAVNQVVKLQLKKDIPMEQAQTPAQNRFAQLAAARRAQQGLTPAAPAPAPAAPAPAPAPATNSFGAPAAPAVAAAPRARRAPAPAPAAPPPLPPAPVQAEPTAGSAGPTFKLVIECQDAAELAAITDLVAQALAQ